ncbi:MAG: PHB depolymerase family esterase [Cyanobacteriota/Melainabacteria group bacterium]
MSEVELESVEQLDVERESQDWYEQALKEVYDQEGASRYTETQLKPGTKSVIQLSDQGLSRRYEVYVPKNYDEKTPMPLIMILHGTTLERSNRYFADQLRMEDLADRHGFVAVYPIAHSRPVFGGIVEVDSWNADGLNIMEQDRRYDDVLFLDHVLDDVSGKMSVDIKRISAVGHSAGGMLIQRYQLERPGRLASIASISGTILVNKEAPAGLEQKDQSGVPILIIHGGDDYVLPYNGGSKLAWLGADYFDGANNSRPYLQKILWAKLNGCEKKPRVVLSNNVTVSEFSRCAAGPVFEYKINDQGHKYPSKIEYSRHSSVDTSEIVISYLLSHRMNEKHRKEAANLM